MTRTDAQPPPIDGQWVKEYHRAVWHFQPTGLAVTMRCGRKIGGTPRAIDSKPAHFACPECVAALETDAQPPPTAPESAAERFAEMFSRPPAEAIDLPDYWQAPSVADGAWANKPHRLLYDCLRELHHRRLGWTGDPESVAEASSRCQEYERTEGGPVGGDGWSQCRDDRDARIAELEAGAEGWRHEAMEGRDTIRVLRATLGAVRTDRDEWRKRAVPAERSLVAVDEELRSLAEHVPEGFSTYDVAACAVRPEYVAHRRRWQRAEAECARLRALAGTGEMARIAESGLRNCWTCANSADQGLTCDAGPGAGGPLGRWVQANCRTPDNMPSRNADGCPRYETADEPIGEFFRKLRPDAERVAEFGGEAREDVTGVATRTGPDVPGVVAFTNEHIDTAQVDEVRFNGVRFVRAEVADVGPDEFECNDNEDGRPLAYGDHWPSDAGCCPANSAGGWTCTRPNLHDGMCESEGNGMADARWRRLAPPAAEPSVQEWDEHAARERGQ